LSEDLGDRRCRDAYAHTGEFADDPLVTPARVLTRKPQHQVADLLGDRRSTGSSGIRPPSAYELAIASPAVCPGGRKTTIGSLGRAVGWPPPGRHGHARPAAAGDLAAKNREFVSQHDNFELLELARARPQRRHRKRAPKQEVDKRHDQRQPPWVRVRSGRLYGSTRLRGVLQLPDGFAHPAGSARVSAIVGTAPSVSLPSVPAAS
jgi:hypothetical protein